MPSEPGPNGGHMVRRALLSIKKILFAIISFIPTFLRVLFGVMLIMNGWRWLQRPDAAGFLTETLTFMLDESQPLGPYGAFLSGVVLPNIGLFAFMVSWGEFLSGISLFLGLASRIGAGVSIFLFLNYGLMGGLDSLGQHSIMMAMVATTLIWKSGRKHGLDRWLIRRWPNWRF